MGVAKKVADETDETLRSNDMRQHKRLEPSQVSKLDRPGYYADGDNLYLQVRRGGTKSWILRYAFNGKEREMGLGPIDDLTLAGARKKATEKRQLLTEGIDPIAARRALKESQRIVKLTFDECAEAFIALKSAEWKNPKSAAQWTSSLKTYATPHFGDLPVDAVSKKDVLAALQPIWHKVPETASRVQQRIAAVFDWSVAAEHRPEGPNPAQWSGSLEHLLSAPEKEVKNHRALPANEMGAFTARLRSVSGTGARALEFAILTASRSGEVRGATWSEIDLDAALWTVPAARMKMKREHVVPLSERAVELLRALPQTSELVFPATRGGQLSDMTLSAVTRRMKVDAVPHGFRATFKTWASDLGHHPREIVETALAHAVESKVEGAYQRTTMIARRRVLMSDWAAHCASPHASASVVPIRATSK